MNKAHEKKTKGLLVSLLLWQMHICKDVNNRWLVNMYERNVLMNIVLKVF